MADQAAARFELEKCASFSEKFTTLLFISSLLLKTQWMLAALSELRVNPAVVSRPSPRAHLFVLLPSVVPLVGRGGEDVQEGVRSLLSAIASELNS